MCSRKRRKTTHSLPPDAIRRKVAIADDEPLACEYLQFLISQCPDYEVVWVRNDGQSTLEAVLQEPPDVLLLDIRMPVMNGLEVARRIREVNLTTAVIFVTAYEDFHYAQEAIRVAATDYLIKPIDFHALNTALLRSRQNVANESTNIIKAIVAVPLQERYNPADLVSRLQEYCCWLRQDTPHLFSVHFNPDAQAGNRWYLFHCLPQEIHGNVFWRMLLIDTGIGLFVASTKDQSGNSQILWLQLLAKVQSIYANYVGLATGMMEFHDQPRDKASIAQQIGISPTYLGRIMKELTGETFGQFYLHLRLEAAFRDICNTRLSIAQIAERHGFNYSHHFARTFRNYFGITPMQLRG
jgi:two-component system response regulator YesN